MIRKRRNQIQKPRCEKKKKKKKKKNDNLLVLILREYCGHSVTWFFVSWFHKSLRFDDLF